MGELADQTDIVPMIERSQDLFSIGYQYMTILRIGRLISEVGSIHISKKSFRWTGHDSNERANGSIPDINQLKAHIYLSDVIIESLNSQQAIYDCAKEPIFHRWLSKMESWIEQCQKSILRFQSDLLEIRNKTADNIG